MTDVQIAAASDISWLRLPAAPLTPAVRQALSATVESIGYIRHQQTVVAHRPALLTATAALAEAVLRDPEGALSLRERELIALVVSAENRCDACVIAHIAALRALGADELWAEQVAINYRRAALTPRERALADYALKVTRAANGVEPGDLDAVRATGVPEEGLLEAVAVAAFFNLTNRLNSGLGIQVNREAHESHRGNVPG
ncbi:peroxidase-related enzyme [Brenneria corticis]|uniref:Peroxidase n=1 Tax=Brenneria corticis TaxID=2173106 RepID=A0A2U1U4X9_9GAMM|nr:peroxidase-related enzyme [Brenneria sp. CFCC 11842]PWC16719.1 peroxidase [Brenneria sp. CFCC 11842]